MIAVILGITSCQKDENIDISHSDLVYLTDADREGMTKLGKQLENPYAVNNMQKAWETLTNENSGGRISSEEIEVRTTHLYIRFKPQNEDELTMLTMDSTLILYEIPLDYEVEEGGSSYHDPEIPLGQPTYQYVAVPVGKELPPVEYELLEECYVPEEDTTIQGMSGGRITELVPIVNELLRKAYEITGNLDNEDDPDNGRIARWKPAGRITIMDDPNHDGDVSATNPFNRTIEIGMEGVTVRARNFIRTLTGQTNAAGYYTCDGPRFDSKANYSINWERDNFKIRDGWLSQAKYDGPKRKGDWNLQLTSGVQHYYATIFRAAFHYYYRPIEGLRRPPENGFTNIQMAIKATYQNEDLGGNDALGTHWNTRRFWGSQIKIFSKSKEPIQLYSTTIHELAHAAHWRWDHQDFRNTNAKVAESWARGVEWVLTRMRYPNYLGRARTTGDYTLVVADMIDGPATDVTRINEGYVNADGFDNVQGYTIRQIEDALIGSRQWGSWQQSIIDDIVNPTEGNLNVLFNAYQ